jgi:intracellular multiplication protein IcmL
MAAERAEKYLPPDNDFYRNHYHHVLMGMMLSMILLLGIIGFIFYQALNRPVPVFTAEEPDGKTKQLVAADEPNLLPDTILRWASKAAVAAYTFDFVNYNNQINDVRPYFTDAGWKDYLASVRGLIGTIVQNQLFVTGVVSGTPVISNQGQLSATGYTWRVQIPFLVTYQTSEHLTKSSYYVVITIVQVPTSVNPQGIGIDQFVMVE